MDISAETVTHIAKLARIALTDDEIELFRGQLSSIIGHFDVLDGIDTEGVEPTEQILPLHNVFATDESRPSLPEQDVLAMAPLTDDGYLRVRAVLE